MAKFTTYQMENKLNQRGSTLLLFLCLLSFSLSSMLFLWNEYLELKKWSFDLD